MSSPRTPQTTRSWASTGGMRLRLFSLVVLAAQTATLGHQLLERHQICREHGELIHTGLGHEHAQAQARPGQAATSAELDGKSSVRAAAGFSSEEHEHCGLACTGSKVLLDAPHAVPLQLAVVRSLSAPFAATTPSFRELHRLAPKTSPPV